MVESSGAAAAAGTGGTILVTGGSTFVGAQLAKALAARRRHVRVLTRAPERAKDLRSAGIDVCQGDLTIRSSLDRACQGVRVVYNVAGVTNDRGRGASVCRAVNATAVGTLIEAAAAAGVQRLVQCSTADVHGEIESPPAGEDAPLRPRHAFEQAKLEGERIARKAADRVGIELVVVRPSMTYGPGDCKLVRLFRAVARRRFVLTGRGRSYVHLVYVDDLAEGLRVCGDASSAAGRTYLLAGGEVTTVAGLVELIAREAGAKQWPLRLPVWPVRGAAAVCEWICEPLGVTPPLERRRLEWYTTNRAFDISRARAELGYAPRVDLREGVRRCLEWYRGQSWL